MRRYSSNLAPEEEAINDKSHKPSPQDLSDKGLSYKDAGVDIQAGDALVEAIKPLARSTTRQGVLAGLGGFGALFDLKQAGYHDPILVAGTDGVGTKLKVAIEAARHQTVGIDLVAMCVNDLVVQGAEPLFFLDYFATGHLDVTIGAAVVSGIAEGCRQAGCALIGGETAEMPGMYGDGDYDLAGFAVGAVERQRLLTGDTIAPGDVLLGLAASGPHSNGYSLIRKIVQRSGLAYDDPAPFVTAETAESSLGAALLTPTRIYVSSCLAALKSEQIKGLIHITGGGFQENIPRILPAGTAVEIDCTAWTPPPVFHWLAEVGGVAAAEMMRTFNCGIGMIAVLPAEAEATLSATFRSAGEAVTRIGQVVAHDGDGPQVHLSDLAQAWSS